MTIGEFQKFINENQSSIEEAQGCFDQGLSCDNKVLENLDTRTQKALYLTFGILYNHLRIEIKVNENTGVFNQYNGPEDLVLNKTPLNGKGFPLTPSLFKNKTKFLGIKLNPDQLNTDWEYSVIGPFESREDFKKEVAAKGYNLVCLDTPGAHKILSNGTLRVGALNINFITPTFFGEPQKLGDNESIVYSFELPAVAMDPRPRKGNAWNAMTTADMLPRWVLPELKKIYDSTSIKLFSFYGFGKWSI